eukprot:756023-Hanusia_phi.AAC.12
MIGWHHIRPVFLCPAGDPSRLTADRHQACLKDISSGRRGIICTRSREKPRYLGEDDVSKSPSAHQKHQCTHSKKKNEEPPPRIISVPDR